MRPAGYPPEEGFLHVLFDEALPPDVAHLHAGPEKCLVTCNRDVNAQVLVMLDESLAAVVVALATAQDN